MKISEPLPSLAGPAQRALAALHIKSLKDLTRHTRSSLAALHGMGPAALRLIEKHMRVKSLSFAPEKALPAKIKFPDPQTVDEYLLNFPGQTRAKLEQVRSLILKQAPGATEKISYKMPGYFLNGVLVYFAGYQHHIGFYPGGKALSSFQKEVAPFVHAKGSVQFPLTKPLPLALIKKITAFRLAENLMKAPKKAPAKRKSPK